MIESVAVLDKVELAVIFVDPAVHFPLTQMRPAVELQSPCLFPYQSMKITKPIPLS